PFLHAIAKLTSETAEATLESYFTLLGALDVTEKCDAYNLLATRKWMLLVPRSREAFESISINSLGFAGTFFVRNEKQFNLIKERGPITALTHVARSSIRESSVDDSLNF
ncbi:MAG: phosphorylase, partial [Okeania sp. SIO2H7]|nr:phosphorylase [Okeania sp. SIO2H7]